MYLYFFSSQAFGKLSDKLEPLAEGVRTNRLHWLDLAQEVQNKTKNGSTSNINGISNTLNAMTDADSAIGVSDKNGQDIKVHSKRSDDDHDNFSNGYTSTGSNISTPPPTGEDDDSLSSPIKKTIPQEAIEILQSTGTLQNSYKINRSISISSCSNIQKDISISELNKFSKEHSFLNQHKNHNRTLSLKHDSERDRISYSKRSSHVHHRHSYHHQRKSHSSMFHQTSVISASNESDKIPKIVGRLSNHDSRQLFSSFGVSVDQQNGICFPPNGHLHFLSKDQLLRRRHSETNGAAISCDK